MTILLPSILERSPLELSAAEIPVWFEAQLDDDVPEYDGTLETAREAAVKFARKAKAANTRRAYRAAIRIFCAWCAAKNLPCLPAAPDDVAAFLAEQRQLGKKVNTIEGRRAAIRYMHRLAGLDLPTGQAAVSETVAGIRHDAALAGEFPVKKLAARVAIIRAIIETIPLDFTGLRDRALILVGFAGALRVSELAKIRVEHLIERARGIELFLPRSKGDRGAVGVTVFLPAGETDLCPVRAIKAWREAAGITEGPLFRRIWRFESPKSNPDAEATFRLGENAIDNGTVGRMLKRRGVEVGLAPELVGSHSLKRGALTTGMDNNIHPARLKQLGRHQSYKTLGEYLELGDGFESHALNGLI